MTDKHDIKGADVTINVSYNQNPMAPKETRVCQNANLTFQCDATLVVVCQYNDTGKQTTDHSPFASGDFVFTVPKGGSGKRKIKAFNSTQGSFKYTVAVIPDDGSRVKTEDPTIIILESL
jgi:hypothetical protein